MQERRIFCSEFSYITHMLWFNPEGSYTPHSHSLTDSPGGMSGENRKKKVKLVG